MWKLKVVSSWEEWEMMQISSLMRAFYRRPQNWPSVFSMGNTFDMWDLSDWIARFMYHPGCVSDPLQI